MSGAYDASANRLAQFDSEVVHHVAARRRVREAGCASRPTSVQAALNDRLTRRLHQARDPQPRHRVPSGVPARCARRWNQRFRTPV